MGIEITPFIHNSATPESYIWLNEVYYSVKDLGWFDGKNEKKLRRVYQLFNITDPPREADGSMMSPVSITNKFLDKKFDIKEMCRDDV